jgi:hypothetical protein
MLACVLSVLLITACGVQHRSDGATDALSAILMERGVPDAFARLDRHVFFHDCMAAYFREHDDSRKSDIIEATHIWIVNTSPIANDVVADFYLIMARELLASPRDSLVHQEAFKVLMVLPPMWAVPHPEAVMALAAAYERDKGKHSGYDARLLDLLLTYDRIEYLDEAKALLQKIGGGNVNHEGSVELADTISRLEKK